MEFGIGGTTFIGVTVYKYLWQYCNSVGKTRQKALSSLVPLGGCAGICIGFMMDFMALPAQPGLILLLDIANDGFGVINIYNILSD